MARAQPTDRELGEPRFEAQWRRRFEEFAELCEDDAGIAGWSPSGLATRFSFFCRRWQGAAKGSSWLDVGCGAGTYSGWLAQQDLAVVGVDYSQPTLVKARSRLPAAIALCAGDATQLPFLDASFDGAICFGVLQAVSDSSSVVAEIARVLKPGATLWIDALNRDGLAARLSEARRWWQRKPRHLRYESAATLERTIANGGFDAITRHWLPIAPARLLWLRPALEAAALDRLPVAARLCSHSIVYSARRLR